MLSSVHLPCVCTYYDDPPTAHAADVTCWPDWDVTGYDVISEFNPLLDFRKAKSQQNNCSPKTQSGTLAMSALDCYSR